MSSTSSSTSSKEIRIIKSNVRMLYSRVQTLLRQRRRKQQKPAPEIVSFFLF